MISSCFSVEEDLAEDRSFDGPLVSCGLPVLPWTLLRIRFAIFFASFLGADGRTETYVSMSAPPAIRFLSSLKLWFSNFSYNRFKQNITATQSRARIFPGARCISLAILGNLSS